MKFQISRLHSICALLFWFGLHSACTYIPPNETQHFAPQTRIILIKAENPCSETAPGGICAQLATATPAATQDYLVKRGFVIVPLPAGSTTFKIAQPFTDASFSHIDHLPDADLVFVYSAEFRRRTPADIAKQRAAMSDAFWFPLIFFAPFTDLRVPEAEWVGELAVFDAHNRGLIHRNTSSQTAPRFDGESAVPARLTLLKLLLANGPNTGSGDWYRD